LKIDYDENIYCIYINSDLNDVVVFANTNGQIFFYDYYWDILLNHFEE
jgi:hypothetical protein